MANLAGDNVKQIGHQTLEITVPVEIPKGFVLIEEKQLNQLAKESLTAKAWTLADLRKLLGGKSEAWIKENTIWNPRYNDEIKQMLDDRVIVGGGHGRSWLFKASAFGSFLEKHWKEFDW